MTEGSLPVPQPAATGTALPCLVATATSNNTKDNPMARHTTMPPRTQKTPHGDVSLTSRWMRDRYYLVASGSMLALRWLMPRRQDEPESHGLQHRIAFPPSPTPVTIERDLRRICAKWQEHWDQRLYNAIERTVGETDRADGPVVRTFSELITAYLAARQACTAS